MKIDIIRIENGFMFQKVLDNARYDSFKCWAFATWPEMVEWLVKEGEEALLPKLSIPPVNEMRFVLGP